MSITEIQNLSSIQDIILYIVNQTDGWFFFILLMVLFLIILVPTMLRWGTDMALFSASFSVMLVGFILWLMQGISEVVLFITVLLWIISIIKLTVFGGSQ